MKGSLRLLHNKEGATLVEFALIAPVFLLMIFGAMEFSIIMFTKSAMEGATNITSRLGKTGYTEEGTTREEMLVALLVERSRGVLDPEKVEVETLVYESFDQINEPEPLSADLNGNGSYDPGDTFQDINGNGQWDDDLGSAGLGGPGDIVVYTINYPWHLKTPVMSHLIGNDEGNFPISTSVVVRNEPYDNGS